MTGITKKIIVSFVCLLSMLTLGITAAAFAGALPLETEKSRNPETETICAAAINPAELREIRASLAASEEYEGLTYEEVTAAIAYSVELYRDADEITLYGFGERETTVVRPQKNKVNTEDAYFEKTRGVYEIIIYLLTARSSEGKFATAAEIYDWEFWNRLGAGETVYYLFSCSNAEERAEALLSLKNGTYDGAWITYNLHPEHPPLIHYETKNERIKLYPTAEMQAEKSALRAKS